MRSPRRAEKWRAKCGLLITMVLRSKSAKIGLLGTLAVFVTLSFLTSSSEESRSRQFQRGSDCNAGNNRRIEGHRGRENVTLDIFGEKDFAAFNSGKDKIDLDDCVLATHLQVSTQRTFSL